MKKTATDSSVRQDRLNQILLDYVEALESGKVPDRHALLAKHPEFAVDLEEFLSSRDEMERLAQPLKQPAMPEAPPLGNLGDFRLLHEIGRGGMGVVYEAFQISLNRRVALKVLPFAAAMDPKHLQRFKNEAMAAAQLHHTNIVPVFAVGSERGVHYYAMQLIEGQSLASMIQELRRLANGIVEEQSDSSSVISHLVNEVAMGRIEPSSKVGDKSSKDLHATRAYKARSDRSTIDQEARLMPTSISERTLRSKRYYRRVADLGRRAATALEHAHQMNVVHRDIKPANLLLDNQGNLWITDFGLALFQSEAGLTLSGELLGTLRYMSPEQALARRGLVDHRTDIYSLAATLYEMLTLRPVFEGNDRHELFQKIANEEPLPPRQVDASIPIELETIVLKAMSKQPHERYASAQDFADDLGRFLDDKPIEARRPTAYEKSIKWARRNKPLVFAGLLLMVLTSLGSVAMAVVIARENAETKQQAEIAARQRERAERNFMQAWQAVDNFLLIGEEELAGKPGLEKVRKRILEAARDYYQEFIMQHQDDPATFREMQEQLQGCYDRVFAILEQVGTPADALAFSQSVLNTTRKLPENQQRRAMEAAMEARARGLFFANGSPQIVALECKEVQEELCIDDDQRRQIESLALKLHEEQPFFMERFEKSKPPDRSQVIVQLRGANEQALAQILSPQQCNRLQQILVQQQGVIPLLHHDMAEYLKLSPGQCEELKCLMDAQKQHRGSSIYSYFYGESKAGSSKTATNLASKKTMDIKASIQAKVESILTPEQRTKLHQVMGKPFSFDSRVRWPASMNFVPPMPPASGRSIAVPAAPASGRMTSHSNVEVISHAGVKASSQTGFKVLSMPTQGQQPPAQDKKR